MRKTILISLFVFVILASSAFATWVEVEGGEERVQNDDNEINGHVVGDYKAYYEFDASIHLDKGWNLVQADISSFHEDSVLPDSELTMDDLGTVYAFFPKSKNYYHVHPEDRQGMPNVLPEELEEPKVNAKWVYAKKAGTFKAKGYIYYDVALAFTGWNLVGLNHFWEGAILDESEGNCFIQRAYEFSNGAWKEWDLQKPIKKNDIGKGLAVKVRSDCVLQQEQAAPGIAAPPELPN